MQDENRNFYDELATRIRFMRSKRGLSLQALSQGPATTAKSWENGSRPRPDQWEGIAQRLGLSVSFVFLGKPTNREDFDFIAKYADELPRKPGLEMPAEVWSELARPPEEYSGRESPNNLAAEARRVLEDALRAANNDPALLGWIVGQLRIHLASLLMITSRAVAEREKQDGSPSAAEPPKVTAARVAARHNRLPPDQSENASRSNPSSKAAAQG